MVSGKEEGAAISQQITQVKRLPKQVRQEIFDRAGIKPFAYIDRRQGSVLRTSLNLSWSKHRALRRMMRSSGIKFDAEKNERILQDDIQCSGVAISMRQFEAEQQNQ